MHHFSISQLGFHVGFLVVGERVDTGIEFFHSEGIGADQKSILYNLFANRVPVFGYRLT